MVAAGLKLLVGFTVLVEDVLVEDVVLLLKADKAPLKLFVVGLVAGLLLRPL